MPAGRCEDSSGGGGMGSSSAVPAAGGTERGHSTREWRGCFLCGCPGHGVNRCSQVDTSFPFMGQGSAFRIIGDQGITGGSRIGGQHGSCQWGVGLDTVGHRARTLFRHWGAIPLKFVGRITDSCRSGPRRCCEAGTRLCWTLRSGWGWGCSHSVVPPVSRARKNGRGMRPAGGDRPSPHKNKGWCGPVVRGDNRVVLLSVEVEEFSLRTVPKNRVPNREGSDSSENCVPSRELPEGVVERSEAVVSTTAVAGASAPAVFAGAPMFRPLP